ncbi:MAG TPA: GNAT family N-acetyltransferase [Cyclobacteriaceae bacterium]|nr:GNAT family N-acetyltransferase [Cyclobacteriaceae bacterium]
MKKIALNDIVISNYLQPGDMGYVTYLHGKLYREEYQFGHQFEAYVAEGLLEFYHQYDPKNNRVWVCRHKDQIIGFLVLMNRGKAAQLRYFIIEPAYRGIGLGRKLMEEYMTFLKACGYTSSYLLTTHELGAAAHLYTAHGFKLTEEKESAAFGRPLKEQRYDLSLE